MSTVNRDDIRKIADLFELPHNQSKRDWYEHDVWSVVAEYFFSPEDRKELNIGWIDGEFFFRILLGNYPDFKNSYICEGEDYDGKDLSDEEFLDYLIEEHVHGWGGQF